MTGLRSSLTMTAPFVSASWLSVVVDAPLFAALVWTTLGLVVAVFAYLLYGVIRAGGVSLTDDGH